VTVAAPVLRGNDYGPLERPDAPPHLSVSVVIPAYGQQDKLDATLASLAAQTYPAGLMEVVVVDDGSEPALRLPEIRPESTRIVAPLPGGWASAHATNSGAAQSDGDVILRLDADMLVFHDHVAAQLRWHHAADYLAVLGHKRFVDYRAGDLDPVDVFEAVRAGKAAELFDAESAQPQWIEQIIDATAGLRQADHRAFRVLVGASFSVHRSLFDASGGMDAEVLLGSDTVFGYRLHQAGAVFVPDDQSSAWHLGPRQIAERGELAKAYRRPRIANRVPELDRKRPRATRIWETPAARTRVHCRHDPGGHGPRCPRHAHRRLARTAHPPPRRPRRPGPPGEAAPRGVPGRTPGRVHRRPRTGSQGAVRDPHPRRRRARPGLHRGPRGVRQPAPARPARSHDPRRRPAPRAHRRRRQGRPSRGRHRRRLGQRTRLRPARRSVRRERCGIRNR
jgi:glycosyltransferase involved in cell wall biosynthesis